MPNQNKCDHSIGLMVDSETWEVHDVINVTVSTLTGKWYTEMFLRRLSSNNINADNLVRRFTCCPDCGAKIDWEKIEEMVKNEQ